MVVDMLLIVSEASVATDHQETYNTSVMMPADCQTQPSQKGEK